MSGKYNLLFALAPYLSVISSSLTTPASVLDGHQKVKMSVALVPCQSHRFFFCFSVLLTARQPIDMRINRTVCFPRSKAILRCRDVLPLTFYLVPGATRKLTIRVWNKIHPDLGRYAEVMQQSVLTDVPGLWPICMFQFGSTVPLRLRVCSEYSRVRRGMRACKRCSRTFRVCLQCTSLIPGTRTSTSAPPFLHYFQPTALADIHKLLFFSSNKDVFLIPLQYVNYQFSHCMTDPSNLLLLMP